LQKLYAIVVDGVVKREIIRLNAALTTVTL